MPVSSDANLVKVLKRCANVFKEERIALLRGSQLRLHALGVTVDLMRPRDIHDRELFRRKRKKRIGDRLYWIVAPEDFILQKLKVGRPRDFEDALSVLTRSGGKLDRAYIRRWVTRLGITREWKYLLSQ